MSDSAAETARHDPDHVLGVFARERLSEALSAMHRAGFGPYTRVFDGQRSNAASQLARAGLEITVGEAPGPEDLVIVVQAPGRVDRVAGLFRQIGAQMVTLAQRSTARQPDITRSLLVPDIEIPPGIDHAAGHDA